MIKVLHLLWRLDEGGIESFCTGLLNHIDRNSISLDFAVCGEKMGGIEGFVKEMGCSVYHLPLIQGKRGKKVYSNSLYNLLQEKEYDIIHSHLAFMNISTLSVAWRCGIKGRISHAHVAIVDSITWKDKYKLRIKQFLMKFTATNCFGCSESTSIDHFGNIGGKVEVLYSGVDTGAFLKNDFSEIRKKHFVIVARMAKEKNPLFIIEIIRELLLLSSEYTFTWYGDGELFDLILEKSHDIQKNLCLKGRVDNIEDYLQEASYMLMPSIREGLGMAAIEAQMANVFVFASDKVPNDTDLGLIKYISLEKNAKEWANYINDFIIEERHFSCHLNQERINRFDIQVVAKKVVDIYQKLYYR